jgi:NTE family protein
MKKVALSLRGGMARGLGAIGVLRFLEEEGIEPYILAGSSSGGMVAAANAYGFSSKEIHDLLVNVRPSRYLSILNLIAKGSLIRKKKFIHLIEKFTGLKYGEINIEDLKTKLVLFASDKVKSEKIMLDKGELFEKILISSAYPVICPQPDKKNKHLTDGDLIAGYSANALRELGAEVVIGVGYKPKPMGKSTVSSNLPGMLMDVYRMIGEEMHELTLEKDPPDFEVLYPVGDHGYLDFKNIAKLESRAYREIRKQRDAILEAIK